MAPVPKELFYGQKIDKDGVFHVDFRHPDGSIVHFTEKLDDVIGVSGRKATNGQTGFFSSKLTNDIRLDAKDPWKIHYKACSAEGTNDWTNDTYDLLQIIDFDNNMISFQKQTVLVETHSASMTKSAQESSDVKTLEDGTLFASVTKDSASSKEVSSNTESTSTKEVSITEEVHTESKSSNSKRSKSSRKAAAAAKTSISTKKDALASQNKTVSELKKQVASMESAIKADEFKDAKDRAKYQRDLDTKALELINAKKELGGIKSEVEKLREQLAAEEADDLMIEAIHELQVAEMNLQLESAQSEIEKLKSTVHGLEAHISEDLIQDQREREAHIRDMLELKHKTDLEVGFARSKAEMEEAKELITAQDRLQLEERLRITEARLAEQDRTISARLLNIGRTYGDYAHLNTEIKERDLQMALLYQDQSDMYRELSSAHERFSTVDMERLSMKEESRRVVSEYATLKHDLSETSLKFKRLSAEYRKQEAALKQTAEEKAFMQRKCSTLETETDELRRELLALKLQNSDLKSERTALRTRLEKAETTITGHEVVIKHSAAWKALYEQQVQTLRKELSEITAVMARLEQSYQDTAKAFRIAQTEKEKLQSELVEVKYSKTAVEARVVIVEQALQAVRAELSQLSKSYEQKDDELRALSGVRAVLERRLSELSLSHTHERNVTRNLSDRLVHVQGNLAENVDWMYDMRSDLTEESKYLYLHHLHNGGGVGIGLHTPPLPRLPSYGSAVNSRTNSPAKESTAFVEGGAASMGMSSSPSGSITVDVKSGSGGFSSATYASVTSHGAAQGGSVSEKATFSSSTSTLTRSASSSETTVTLSSQSESITEGAAAATGEFQAVTTPLVA